MQNEKISPQEFISVLQKLLSEKVPTENLVSLGKAIASLKFDDWKKVSGSILIKDLKPIVQTKKKIISFKELRETIKGSIKNATVSIPEAKDRVALFSKRIMSDYNGLKNNEDKGRYILKLSLYASVFALAFQKGSKQRMLSASTLPLMTLGVTLLFINRVLEQAEENLTDKPEAIKLSQDIRSLLRTLNMGFSSGMTFNVVVDGLVDQKINIHDLNGKTIGALMPKSIIDNMIYATLMGLFSSEKKPNNN